MAAKYSVEASGHHLNGDVPPIKKHSDRPLMEKYAWTLKQGEMSGIIQVGEKFIILLCLPQYEYWCVRSQRGSV